MKPYLSSGRMITRPPAVPANWNAVIASTASATGYPAVDRMVGVLSHSALRRKGATLTGAERRYSRNMLCSISAHRIVCSAGSVV